MTDRPIISYKRRRKYNAAPLDIHTNQEGKPQLPARISYVMPTVDDTMRKQARRGQWTDDALLLVEEMAANGRTQKTIAAAFGLTLSMIDKQFRGNAGDNPLRLAWEFGNARDEQDYIDVARYHVLDSGDKKPDTLMFMWLTKNRHGWKDKQEDNTAKGPAIQINLPGPMKADEYYKMLGLDGPVDGRLKNVTPATPALGAPEKSSE